MFAVAFSVIAVVVIAGVLSLFVFHKPKSRSSERPLGGGSSTSDASTDAAAKR